MKRKFQRNSPSNFSVPISHVYQKQKIQVSEGLTIGIALAFTGGFLDAYTYLLCGGVFANAQTGNLVLLGIRVAKGEGVVAGYYLIPILAFVAGVVVTELIKRKVATTGKFHWRQIIILTEAVLLFVIGWFPLTTSHAVINVTIAFVCSVQVASFRKLRGAPYATTMCTGNLRSGVDQAFLFVFEGNKRAGRDCFGYFIIIATFCVGAAVGAVCIDYYVLKSIWVCCGVLLGVFLYLFFAQAQVRTD